MTVEHCKHMQVENLGKWVTVSLPDGRQIQVKKSRGRTGLRVNFYHPQSENFKYEGECLIDLSIQDIAANNFGKGSGVDGICDRCKRRVRTKLL